MRAISAIVAVFLLFVPPVSVIAAADQSLVDEVPLERKGGVFFIPVQINGAITLQFIIDSGAADVQIPADVFLTLLRTGTIGRADLLGERSYRLADGSTQRALQFLVRELRVGDHVLHNVPASVGPATGPLLLGQSFLSRFAGWALDNERHVLKLTERSAGETRAAPPPATLTAPTAAITRPSEPQQIAPHPETARVCGRAVSYVVEQSAIQTGWLGVWSGNWNNRGSLCGGLIVEKIDPTGATELIYVYGPLRPGSRLSWKAEQRIGTVNGGVLTFQDDQGSTFAFSGAGFDTLNASFVSRSGRLSGLFHKIR